MGWQDFVALLLVAVAAVYLARVGLRMLVRRSDRAGCGGCSGCSSSKTPTPLVPIENPQPVRRQDICG